MKRLILPLFSIALVLFLVGCYSQTTVKYQCTDGAFVDSADLCSSKTCPETNCPKLDCSACPVKTETKIETKTVTNIVYVCSDLREVRNKDDCKNTEQREIESATSDLVITINNERSSASIGSYSLENLQNGEHYVIVDFSIYNKGIEAGYEFNPNLILLEDSRGYSYSYSWDSSQLSKYWEMVSIEYNTKKSGELAFVVPETEKEFILVVNDFSGVKGKKTFSLN